MNKERMTFVIYHSKRLH